MAGQAQDSGSGSLTHGGLTGGTGVGGLGSVHHYCGVCAGLIPAENSAYVQGAKLCHCPGHVRQFPSDTLKKWWEHESQKVAAPPTMTPHDFVVWLRGFFTGRSVLPTDPQLEALLRATLDKVKP